MKIIRLFFLFFCVIINSQNSSKYSNEFMNIGVDASSIALSGSVVSSIDNVNSTYWNPAGLTNLEDNEISLMHSNYFANIANYNFVAYASPIDKRSTIGFSIIRFGVDDILLNQLRFLNEITVQRCSLGQMCYTFLDLHFNRIYMKFISILNV